LHRSAEVANGLTEIFAQESKDQAKGEERIAEIVADRRDERGKGRNNDNKTNGGEKKR
jgi:hypothetical protein